jgi:hypothetical protein
VRSTQGAVLVFRSIRFLGLPPEPGVPVIPAPGSPQVPLRVAVVDSISGRTMGWQSRLPGSDSAWCACVWVNSVISGVVGHHPWLQ